MRAKGVTVMRWYAQDEVNQKERFKIQVDEVKKGANSYGEVETMYKLNVLLTLITFTTALWVKKHATRLSFLTFVTFERFPKFFRFQAQQSLPNIEIQYNVWTTRCRRKDWLNSV